MSDFFKGIAPVPFKGPDSDDPMAFRFYEPDRMVLGKRMEDQLRMAICYWHSFAWPGSDPFGGQTFERPWFGAGHVGGAAEGRGGLRDVHAPRGEVLHLPRPRRRARRARSLGESNRNVREVADFFARRMEETGIELLWGTANLFSNRRFMAGAATNPDPEVFAYAAAQVKSAMDVTHELKGANYVLWGGREGYETLLNTDMKQELDHMGRFLHHGGRLQAQDRLQGRHPDRAEAAGADQAPVRLRRGHRVRLPAALRAGEGGQGQHRGRPRRPRRAFLRARDRHRGGARHLRLDRRQPQRLPVGLGHRPVPEQRARDDAGACTTS